jgi:2-phosphosulfolactate phosphatase
MAHALNVYTTPNQVDPERLADGTVVVIDVLRASTTIVHALEAGAKEVIPCVEVEEALALAKQMPDYDIVLAGERNGLPIDGFHLGNSPSEYTPHSVGGKAVVFTTTNGTRAIAHARAAKRILIGAFVNVSAVFNELVEQDHIHLLCAGTHGRVSQDDVLLAGMLVERIQRRGGLLYEQNAPAVEAQETWLKSFALPRVLGAEPLEPERLAGELRKSAGGRHLLSIGLEDDILAAACIDRFNGVPEMDPERVRIRLV